MQCRADVRYSVPCTFFFNFRKAVSLIACSIRQTSCFAVSQSLPVITSSCGNFLLCIPHGSIFPAFRQKLVMCARFCNSAVRHNKYLICIFHDGQCVSNHNYSLFLFQKISDCLLYSQLIFNIKRRRCFIQQQDRTVFQDSAGNRNPLPLTT